MFPIRATNNDTLAFFSFLARAINPRRRFGPWDVMWLCFAITGDGRYLPVYLIVATVVFRLAPAILFWIMVKIVMERWMAAIMRLITAPTNWLAALLGRALFAVLCNVALKGIILILVMLLFGMDMTAATLINAATLRWLAAPALAALAARVRSCFFSPG